MMTVVDYRPVEMEYIEELACVMRPAEQRDYAAAFGDAKNGLLHGCQASNGDLKAGFVDDKLMGIFGLVRGWMDDPDIASPWLALSRHAPALTTVRESKKIVNEWASGVKLLCNLVPEFDEDAIKLLRFLGFQFLNEGVKSNGIMRLPFYMVGGKL